MPFISFTKTVALFML